MFRHVIHDVVGTRRASLRAALRVSGLCRGLVGVKVKGESKSDSESRSKISRLIALPLLAFDLHASAYASVACRPGGRRAWMRGVFRQDRDVLSKNPRLRSACRLALSGKGAFLWLLSFSPFKKKVTRPRSGRKLCSWLYSKLHMLRQVRRRRDCGASAGLRKSGGLAFNGRRPVSPLYKTICRTRNDNGGFPRRCVLLACAMTGCRATQSLECVAMRRQSASLTPPPHRPCTHPPECTRT